MAALLAQLQKQQEAASLPQVPPAQDQDQQDLEARATRLEQKLDALTNALEQSN
jgi:hypothetical protein